MFRTIVLFLSIITVGLTTGCSNLRPAEHQKSVLSDADKAIFQGNTVFKKQVSIGAVSGEQTPPSSVMLLVSSIDNENFKKALTSSLEKAGIFSEDIASARYVLDARILEIERDHGLTCTYTTKIQYDLSEKSTNNKLFSELITTKNTGTISDSWKTGEPLPKIVMEGAISKSIRDVFTKLHKLGIDIAKIEQKKKRQAEMASSVAGVSKVNRFYRVKAGEATIYWEPNTTAEEVAKLKQTDLVYVTHATNSGWHLIHEAGTNYGWMHKSVLVHDNDAKGDTANAELSVRKRIQQYEDKKRVELAKQQAAAARAANVNSVSPETGGNTVGKCAAYLAKKKACDKLGYFGSMACMAVVSDDGENCF